jgi:hypothetical protein
MTTIDKLPDSDEFSVPNVLKVKTATIYIPYTVETDNLGDYELLNRRITHLLALLPDEDKALAEAEDDGFHITTSCQPAIKYACQHYLLDEFSTAVDVVFTYFSGDCCRECLDDLVETVANDYTSKVLSEGVFLVNEAN